MRSDEFLKVLQEDNLKQNGTHTIEPGISATELTEWKKRNGNLSQSFVELLRSCNGLMMHPVPGTSKGVFHLRPLSEMEAARSIMCDRSVPESWLVFGGDADSTLYSVLDRNNGHILIIDPISPEEPEEVWDNIEDFLEWAIGFRKPVDEEDDRQVEKTEKRDRVVAVAPIHKGPVRALACDADESIVASGGDDLSVAICNMDNLERLREFEWPGGSVYGIDIASKENLAVACGDEGRVSVIELRSGRVLRVLSGHKGYVRTVRFSADHRRILSGGGEADKSLRIWNTDLGEPIGCLKGHKKDITCIACVPNKEQCVSVSLDKSLRLWDTAEMREISMCHASKTWVTGIVCTQSGEFCTSTAWDGRISVWALPDLRAVSSWRGHSGPATSVAISPDSKHIASGSLDESIVVWELNSGKEIVRYTGISTGIRCLSFSIDKGYIVAGGDDGSIRVLNPH